ncbi:Cell division protein FtsL [compost metagenome]
MAYTRGNLAVKEQTARREQQSSKYRETTKVVTRRAPLPVREKLLYMLTVVFCVAVMGGLMMQNSRLYNIKRQMYNLDKQIQVLNVEIKELSVQKEMLEEKIPEKAAELGYVQPDEEGFHYDVSSNGANSAGQQDQITTAQK